MKQIAGVEISFDKIIEESSLIESFGNFAQVPISKMWNWDWEGESNDPIEVNVMYHVSDDRKGVLASFLFNAVREVGDLFELDMAIHLSGVFGCNTMVSDPSNGSFFIKASTAQELIRCIEDRDENDNTYYRPVQIVTYEDIQLEYKYKKKDT